MQKNFGVDKNFICILGDVRRIKKTKGLRAGEFDLGVINPPYRNRQMGRVSPNLDKNRARFEEGATLDDFIYAGNYLVKNRGTLCIVYLAERMGYLFSVLKKI